MGYFFTGGELVDCEGTIELKRKCLIAAPETKASSIKITTICSRRVRENIPYMIVRVAHRASIREWFPSHFLYLEQS
jgi:hypothetical protein